MLHRIRKPLRFLKCTMSNLIRLTRDFVCFVLSLLLIYQPSCLLHYSSCFVGFSFMLFSVMFLSFVFILFFTLSCLLFHFPFFFFFPRSFINHVSSDLFFQTFQFSSLLVLRSLYVHSFCHKIYFLVIFLPSINFQYH